MKNIAILFVLVGSLLTISCNQWEKELSLPPTNKPTSGRVVLMEDFTGASCVNCPAGTAVVDGLLEEFPDNLVVVAVHSNFLSTPAVSGEVKLSNPDAQAIENFLGGWTGKPEASINRFKFPNKDYIRLDKPDSWRLFLKSELDQKPIIELSINRSYDSITRNLQIEFIATPKQNISENLHFHVMLTESGIVASQKDQQVGIISNYTCNHVLRKLITPVPGEKITGPFVAGTAINKIYSFTVPQDNILWQDSHLSIVAYVSADESSKYIYQAAETSVK